MSQDAPSFLKTPQGRKIAYHKTDGNGPGIVFLGGFRSNMMGTKALHLEAWAKRQGRAFLRLDYSGHGQSSGDFIDGCIGDWAQDVRAVLTQLTSGPHIIVGSSMGGWIALLLAREMPERFAGFVGLAAAPDFTEDEMAAHFSPQQTAQMKEHGSIELPSDYADEPYIITRRLIEDGRKHLVLRSPLPVPFAMRLIHGTHDNDVPISCALRLLQHAESPDARLLLLKGANHSLSDASSLAVIEATITELT